MNTQITYENIEKANSQLKTTDVKGTPYTEVHQRIKAFRMVYPTGYITTKMESNSNGVCVFRSHVGYYENGQKHELGVGTAYEKENSSFINKTSYIENCETSAVGRALGMAGFGIDISVASVEEVKNAINNQNEQTQNSQKASSKQINLIKNLTKITPQILHHYNVSRIEDIDKAQANELIKLLSHTRKNKENG